MTRYFKLALVSRKNKGYGVVVLGTKGNRTVKNIRKEVTRVGFKAPIVKRISAAEAVRLSMKSKRAVVKVNKNIRYQTIRSKRF